MSVGYVAVQWTPPKKTYDLVVAFGVVAYLAIFFAVGKLLHVGPHAISDEVLAIRALGSCAFTLLHVVLLIGPLARLDRRFLPLLYNRRHLGVVTFVAGFLHGGLALGYYHGFGVVGPLTSLLTINTNFTSLRAFPFQLLGAAALLILFLMAATSHDFWNRTLGPQVWKRLHMLVYYAYGLLVMHVALGALQTDRGPLAPMLVGIGAAAVVGLHLITGRRETLADRTTEMLNVAAESTPDGAAWLDACDIDEVEEKRGKTISAPGAERIALFRHDGRISAVSNVCAHQGGPLGEGRIVNGCITCPWHGWTYRAEDGCSPPPFTERIATYRVRLVGRRVLVDPKPLPPGVASEPAQVHEQV